MTDDEVIYGLDPYKPTRWQRLKNFIFRRNFDPYVHTNEKFPPIELSPKCIDEIKKKMDTYSRNSGPLKLYTGKDLE